MLHAMSTKPAEILGLPQGRLARARLPTSSDFDPAEPYVVDRTKLHSRSKNTPFDDARMEGRVKLTLVGGKIAHEII